MSRVNLGQGGVVLSCVKLKDHKFTESPCAHLMPKITNTDSLSVALKPSGRASSGHVSCFCRGWTTLSDSGVLFGKDSKTHLSIFEENCHTHNNCPWNQIEKKPIELAIFTGLADRSVSPIPTTPHWGNVHHGAICWCSCVCRIQKVVDFARVIIKKKSEKCWNFHPAETNTVVQATSKKGARTKAWKYLQCTIAHIWKSSIWSKRLKDTRTKEAVFRSSYFNKICAAYEGASKTCDRQLISVVSFCAIFSKLGNRLQLAESLTQVRESITREHVSSQTGDLKIGLKVLTSIPCSFLICLCRMIETLHSPFCFLLSSQVFSVKTFESIVCSGFYSQNFCCHAKTFGATSHHQVPSCTEQECHPHMECNLLAFRNTLPCCKKGFEWLSSITVVKFWLQSSDRQVWIAQKLVRCAQNYWSPPRTSLEISLRFWQITLTTHWPVFRNRECAYEQLVQSSLDAIEGENLVHTMWGTLWVQICGSKIYFCVLYPKQCPRYQRTK